MLVLMNVNATDEQTQAVCKRVEELGYRPHPLPGATRCAIGITGNKGAVEADALERVARRGRSDCGLQALQTGQPRHEEPRTLSSASRAAMPPSAEPSWR